MPLSPCFVFVHKHCEQNMVIWIITKLNPILARGYIASVPPMGLWGFLGKSVSSPFMHFLVTLELKLHAKFVILRCPWCKTKGYKELVLLV